MLPSRRRVRNILLVLLFQRVRVCCKLLFRIRLPNNDIAIKILSKLDFPLATTSVNYSGEKPGVKVEDFYEIFKDSVDFIIDAGPSPIGEASTIVRVENNKYEVLREGSIRL